MEAVTAAGAAGEARAASRVIAIGNLKGGVGKSTLAVNLGSALAAGGLPTIVLDTDPQLTSTAWARGRHLPCKIRALPIRDFAAVEGWLEELEAARAGYARVLIDLPATLSPVLAAAFLAADTILIPTSLSPVDLKATRRTVRRARLAAAERLAPPTVLIVPFLVRRDWLGRAKAPSAAMELPMTRAVGFDPAFGEAFDQSDWIGGHAPGSRAHREILGLAEVVEEDLAARAGGGG